MNNGCRHLLPELNSRAMKRPYGTSPKRAVGSADIVGTDFSPSWAILRMSIV